MFLLTLLRFFAGFVIYVSGNWPNKLYFSRVIPGNRMDPATAMSSVSTQLGWSRNLELSYLLFLIATVEKSFYPNRYSIGLVTSNFKHSTAKNQRAAIFEIMKTRVVF